MPPHRIGDLKDRDYGDLHVLYRAPNDRSGHAVWACSCACDRDKQPVLVTASNLTGDRITHCGCKTLTNRREGRAKGLADLAGHEVADGAVRVLRLSPNRAHGGRLWECLCVACGKTFKAATQALLRGDVVGCGCGIERRRRVRAAMTAKATKYSYGGKRLTAVDLAALSGLSITTLRYRLRVGWSTEEAVWGRGGAGAQDDESLIAVVQAKVPASPGAMRTLLDRYESVARGIALDWRRSGAQLDDLIQEARIGLSEAILSWRSGGGASLRTLAHIIATRRIADYVDDTVSTVRLPRYVRHAIRVAKRLGLQDGAEISAVTRQTVPDEAVDIARHGFRLLRLDHPATEAYGLSGLTLGDTLEGGMRPDDLVEQSDDQDASRCLIEAAVATLKPRHQEVLRRVDLSTEPEQLTTIAADWGVTQQSVSQVRNTALKLLRNQLDRQRIRGAWSRTHPVRPRTVAALP